MERKPLETGGGVGQTAMRAFVGLVVTFTAVEGWIEGHIGLAHGLENGIIFGVFAVSTILCWHCIH